MLTSDPDFSALLAPRLLSTHEPDSLVVGLLERPGAVVHFDEVDRVLYELLKGRITTREGSVVSSANATVIMTTNAGDGAWTLPGMTGAQKEEARAATLRACAEVFGDAITSRVTRLLAFPPLAAAAGRSIVELEGCASRSSGGTEAVTCRSPGAAPAEQCKAVR